MRPHRCGRAAFRKSRIQPGLMKRHRRDTSTMIFPLMKRCGCGFSLKCVGTWAYLPPNFFLRFSR